MAYNQIEFTNDEIDHIYRLVTHTLISDFGPKKQSGVSRNTNKQNIRNEFTPLLGDEIDMIMDAGNVTPCLFVEGSNALAVFRRCTLFTQVGVGDGINQIDVGQWHL